MQLVVGVYGSRPTPGTLLHRALSSNCDLTVRLALHALLGISARTDDQPCMSLFFIKGQRDRCRPKMGMDLRGRGRILFLCETVGHVTTRKKLVADVKTKAATRIFDFTQDVRQPQKKKKSLYTTHRYFQTPTHTHHLFFLAYTTTVTSLTRLSLDDDLGSFYFCRTQPLVFERARRGGRG